MQQCPICRHKQSLRNKRCVCGEDLDQAKRSGRIKYYLYNRVAVRRADGTIERVQKWELSGESLEEARTEDAKRKVQKRERRVFEIVPEASMTFEELSRWYLGLDSVKAKAYYPILSINLATFNKYCGAMRVDAMLPADLENYKALRKASGMSDSYVDQEAGAAKRVVFKAHENRKVSADVVLAFRQGCTKLLKRNGNARDRILSPKEFARLVAELPVHTTQILACAFYTGMRYGEILGLKRDQVNLADRIISLSSQQTKDRQSRTIPVSKKLLTILEKVKQDPRGTHFFMFRGRPIRNIRKGLREACERAGILYGRTTPGGFVFHDLRHSFNTFMSRAGVPEKVIMQITGHATREMFDRYRTVDASDLTDAVVSLDRYLGGVISVKANQTANHEGRKKKNGRK